MILYFADRDLSIKGMATTDLDSEFIIYSDTKTESIEKHVCTFDVDIGFDESNRLELEELTHAGNYILRYVGSSDVMPDDLGKAVKNAYTSRSISDCFTIIEREIDIQGKTLTIYAEDLGLDLLNDLAMPSSSSSNRTASSYISEVINKAGFSIGTNQSVTTKRLSWTDTTTITERINSIAESFNVDVAYSFTVKGMTITGKYVDIYNKRGEDTYETLSIGKNLNNIKVKENVTNLATALIPTGADGLNLATYSYDDGDFYLNAGVLYSRDALEKWHRYKTESGHIFRSYSDSSTQQVDLCNNAIKELKKIREPEVNYEVDIADLPEGLGIGDRVYVVDDAGELYIQGRILELKTSVTNGRQEATIGDYKIKPSGISSTVASLASEFAEVAARRVLYTWVIYASDASGTNASIERGERNFTGILTNRTKELTSDEQLTPEVLAKVEWTFMLDSEAASTAVITLTPSNGLIYKGRTIASDITAVITVGETVIQNKTQLAQYFGNTAELVWYVDGVEIQNEGNFVYRFEGTAGLQSVTISCELEVS